MVQQAEQGKTPPFLLPQTTRGSCQVCDGQHRQTRHHGGEEKEARMSISGTKACPFPKQLCQDMLPGCCSTCLELELVVDI